MSTTMHGRRAGTPSQSDGTAEARVAVAQRSQRRDPLRRRWGRLGGGLLAAVLGGWLFASLYLSADDRAEVLVLVDGVDRFEVIERSDLRVVRMSTDTDVESVQASRIEDVVGRVAATDLAAGSLLTDGQLHPRGERLVSAGDAVVGVLVGPDDAPAAGLVRGASVAVVVRPAPATPGDVVEVAGWLLEVDATAASSGDRALSVVVPAADAAAVSSASADRRVSVVVVGG